MGLRVQLVDDHGIVREALRRIIAESTDITVVCESATGAGAVSDFLEHRPEVIVMDISLPNLNGLEAMQQILDIDPLAKVLIFSMFLDDGVITRAMRAGAKGYIDKRHDAQVLIDAIHRVAGGEIYFSNEIAQRLALRTVGAKSVDPAELLSSREFEIFKLSAEGKTPSDIEKLLGIHVKTVQNQLRNIMEKLKVNSTAELAQIAIRSFIIEIKD